MKAKTTAEISDQYNNLSQIWQESDKWHCVTHKMIQQFIQKETNKINLSQAKILNAGSAGNNYCLSDQNVIHIDLAEKKLKNCKNAIVGSIENIPNYNNSFDIIVCVGSVINYCDPVKVLQEFSRTLKPGGTLILEFENSHTLELILKTGFNKKAVLTDTFYNHKSERIWYFSETFIKEILSEMHFKITSIKRCHILSPLIYRFIKNESLSSFFSKFDPLSRIIPGLNKFSSNTILIAHKIA
jgi:ubiquinone/menaquinone biosynthesis C-methylase UbiE